MLLKRLNALEGLTSEEVRLLVALGPGSFVLASTIGTINVGLPAVQDEFDISLSALKWVSIMGSIMMASMSLCFGRLGDILGRRRIYKLGILFYAVFSGLAGASWGLGKAVELNDRLAAYAPSGGMAGTAFNAASLAMDASVVMTGLFLGMAAGTWVYNRLAAGPRQS